MFKRKFITAFLYAFMTPFCVWSGLAFENGDFLLGCILVVIIAAMDFFGVILYVDAVADGVKH